MKGSRVSRNVNRHIRCYGNREIKNNYNGCKLWCLYFALCQRRNAGLWTQHFTTSPTGYTKIYPSDTFFLARTKDIFNDTLTRTPHMLLVDHLERFGSTLTKPTKMHFLVLCALFRLYTEACEVKCLCVFPGYQDCAEMPRQLDVDNLNAKTIDVRHEISEDGFTYNPHRLPNLQHVRDVDRKLFSCNKGICWLIKK